MYAGAGVAGAGGEPVEVAWDAEGRAVLETAESVELGLLHEGVTHDVAVLAPLGHRARGTRGDAPHRSGLLTDRLAQDGRIGARGGEGGPP